MPASAKSRPRPVVDGKFFRLGERKFYIKGLTYGPFAPNDRNEMFLRPTRLRGTSTRFANSAPTCCASITRRQPGSWTWPKSMG